MKKKRIETESGGDFGSEKKKNVTIYVWLKIQTIIIKIIIVIEIKIKSYYYTSSIFDKPETII